MFQSNPATMVSKNISAFSKLNHRLFLIEIIGIYQAIASCSWKTEQ